jgi:hypothetical protein
VDATTDGASATPECVLGAANHCMTCGPYAANTSACANDHGVHEQVHTFSTLSFKTTHCCSCLLVRPAPTTTCETCISEVALSSTWQGRHGQSTTRSTVLPLHKVPKNHCGWGGRSLKHLPTIHRALKPPAQASPTRLPHQCNRAVLGCTPHDMPGSHSELSTPYVKVGCSPLTQPFQLENVYTPQPPSHPHPHTLPSPPPYHTWCSCMVMNIATPARRRHTTLRRRGDLAPAWATALATSAADCRARCRLRCRCTGRRKAAEWYSGNWMAHPTHAWSRMQHTNTQAE